MADIFSIIATLQILEKAYIKDVIEPPEYVSTFDKNNQIIISFRCRKNCEILLVKFVATFCQIEGEFSPAKDFVRKYKVKTFFYKKAHGRSRCKTHN